MGLNVLHGLHLLAEGPAGGLEGHQLVVLAGEAGQVILQLLHTDGKEEKKCQKDVKENGSLVRQWFLSL